VRIELASLESGKGSFSHSCAEDELALNDPGLRLLVPPVVSGNIRKADRAVEVSGHLTARVQVECDRCLKPIEFPVDSKFKLEYVTAGDYESHEDAELSVDELDQTVFDGEAIDLDELVREEVLLAVPDHRLCKTDCKGICPVCGSDKNAADCTCETSEVDPRWAGLKKLVNGKS